MDAGRYLESEEILRTVLEIDSRSVEGHFLLGFALAKQEKWVAAREELERTLDLDPQHGGAYTELAGVEFKLGNRKAAIRSLKRAEKLESDLDYVRTFLATLLFLESKKTEALYYWNQVGAPRVDQISYRASKVVSAQLLQNLFQLNEGEILRREQLLDIRWRQERFRLGSPFNWQLTPRAKGNYDLEIALAPEAFLSSVELLLLENAVRAPLYKEVGIVYPFSLGSGRRFAGSFRWDEPRKRARFAGWLPFVSSSFDRLGLGFDWRDEDWRDALSETEFMFETSKFLASYEYLLDGRKSVGLRGGYEHQNLVLTEPSGLPEDPHFALLGTEWNQRIGLSPADDLQLQIAGALDGFFGYGFERSRAQRVQARAELGWDFDRGSRSEFRFSLGGGYASHSLPLDHYFILGIGQDTPLQLRAHPEVDRGRKGKSPMGRQYLLANLELDRRLLSWQLLDIRGLLFSDTALVDGAPFGTPETQWFQDVGFGIRLGVLGQERIECLFGFDLRESGFNLWVGIPLVRW